MSSTADTPLGRLIHLPSAPHYALLMACCGEWERLDERQMRGEVSVNHAAVCRASGTYHETHDFAAAWLAAHGSPADGI